MPEELTATQAAARLRTNDTLGIPLGPGQPPAFLRALGERADWTDLRVYGALLAVAHRTVLATGGGLSVGLLRTTRAGAARFRCRHRFHAGGLPALRAATRTAGPSRDDDRRVAARRRRLVLAFATRGRNDRRIAPRRRRSRSGTDRRGVGVLSADVRARRTPPRAACRRDRHPRRFDRRPAGVARRRRAAPEADKAIARHAVGFIPSGATLQVGIGSIPNQIATLLAEGDGGDYGLHSEMFTDGCMKLHRAGKISNTRKGQYARVSVTTFAFGSQRSSTRGSTATPTSHSCRSRSSTRRR